LKAKNLTKTPLSSHPDLPKGGFLDV
jgi:hypothetical protein